MDERSCGQKRAAAPGAAARSGLAAIALAITFALPAGAAASTASLSDASADTVRAKTVVPDSGPKVGEVRLLSRGDGVVVQTLLSTKLLSRVIAEIGKKEEHSWPPDGDAAAQAGGAAAREYLAALHSAQERLEKAQPDNAAIDRRRRVLIEFAADADSAIVLVGTFDATGEVGNLVPGSREIFSTLALPRPYILREIRLILADSFKIDENDVDRLGPLGPAAANASAAPDSPEPATPEPANAPAAAGPNGSAKPVPKKAAH